MNKRIEVYRDAAGEFRWRFRVAISRTVAESGEGYTELAGLESALLILWPTADPWYERGRLSGVCNAVGYLPIEYQL